MREARGIVTGFLIGLLLWSVAIYGGFLVYGLLKVLYG